jgi:hypothetical protein
MCYIKRDYDSSRSIFDQLLSVISTKPTREYQIPPEDFGPLKDLLASKSSPSGVRLISATRAWWTRQKFQNL